MIIILENSVEVAKKSMLGSIIAAITKVQTSYECSNLSIISRCLCIHNHTFLVMGKQSSNNL